jgi:hypothetical protein
VLKAMENYQHDFFIFLPDEAAGESRVFSVSLNLNGLYFSGKTNCVRIRSMSKSSTWTFVHKNALKTFNSIINMNFEKYTIQSIDLTIVQVYQFERLFLHEIMVIYNVYIPHLILHMVLHPVI